MAIRYISSAMVLFCLAGPVYAQDAAAPQANQGLDEIIVTAQKREQNLQNVPVAVTAVTGDTLVAKNVTQFENLTTISPSLTITTATTTASSSINLRGIGTFAFSTGIEPSVAVVVDDVAIVQQAQAFSGLSDIERIEVLRGPQGTLFGKNASAGAINIVTKAPTDYFSGHVRASATTDEEYRVEAGFSGPLGEGVAFRVNGYYSDREGYIKNLFNGNKLAGETNWGLRGRLTAKLSDAVDVSLTADHTDNKANGIPRTYRVLPAGAVGFASPPFSPGTPLASSAVGLTPGPDNYSVIANVDPDNRQKQSSASFRATLDLGPVKLLSITSYQDWKFSSREDVDLTAIPFFGPNGVVQGGNNHSKVFAQETRLISDISGPLSYLVGLYYANAKTARSFERTPNGPLLSRWSSNVQSQTYAAFGQATYDISEATHVDAGIRFNREEINVGFLRTTPGACTTRCVGNSADNHITYKLALRQDLSRGVMAYASYATGYKGQGYDISSSFSPAAAANPVRPETSKAYEIGIKSRFLDNRVQLNIAAFLTDYNDFQAQSAVVQPDQSILFQLNNVGKLRTKGIEFELSARPVEALTLGFSGAYIDAKIRSYPFANCYTGQTAAQGCFDIDGAGPRTTTAQNLAGKPLANSPKFKYTVSANYDVALPSAPFDGFITFDWRYQSKVSFDLNQNPLFTYGGYGVFNGSLGVKGRDDAGYRVTLFVNNLFDKHYVSGLGANPGASLGVVNQVFSRDSRRYFGIRGSYDF